MEQRDTDPKLLSLILAVMGFIEAENEPKNPFVKGLGSVKNNQQSYEYLVEAVNACKEYYPEVEEMVDSLLLEMDDDETNSVT